MSAFGRFLPIKAVSPSSALGEYEKLRLSLESCPKLAFFGDPNPNLNFGPLFGGAEGTK
jgi:hypothetical protein